jgi:uncharacterized Ntn-hydrolase superfamily protein
MRVMTSTRFLMTLLSLLGGCATTSDVGQVREVAPGTYKVRVGRGGNSTLFAGHEASDAAVDQAGKYCHAKGQKLVIVPEAGRDVVFRCEASKEPITPPPSN